MTAICIITIQSVSCMSSYIYIKMYNKYYINLMYKVLHNSALPCLSTLAFYHITSLSSAQLKMPNLSTHPPSLTTVSAFFHTALTHKTPSLNAVVRPQVSRCCLCYDPPLFTRNQPTYDGWGQCQSAIVDINLVVLFF